MTDASFSHVYLGRTPSIRENFPCVRSVTWQILTISKYLPDYIIIAEQNFLLLYGQHAVKLSMEIRSQEFLTVFALLENLIKQSFDISFAFVNTFSQILEKK